MKVTILYVSQRHFDKAIGVIHSELEGIVQYVSARFDEQDEKYINMFDESNKNLEEFKLEMKGFKQEMVGFKVEMLIFKDEMYSFRDEMHLFKSEMYSFRKEMYEFRDEMHEFKNEMYIFRDEVLKRFDRLEFILTKVLKNHEERLKLLEVKQD